MPTNGYSPVEKKPRELVRQFGLSLKERIPRFAPFAIHHITALAGAKRNRHIDKHPPAGGLNKKLALIAIAARQGNPILPRIGRNLRPSQLPPLSFYATQVTVSLFV
jgi:hypothetical protein